jgi:acyl phosphate:glycerol-3-phosphate acyltransferase
VIFALLIAAFIIGSVPTGNIIASIKGIDLRKTGSGNIGATNVMRSMGRTAALLTLIGDMLKGALAIIAARTFFPEAGTQFSEMISFLPLQISMPGTAFEGAVGMAAILGHNFSIFLRFRGGKGVATSLGVALLLSPYAALLAATAWLVTFNLSRYSSLSAIVAFGLFPGCIYMIDYSAEKIVVAIIIALLIFITHRGNIARLIAGTENKFTRNRQ